MTSIGCYGLLVICALVTQVGAAEPNQPDPEDSARIRQQLRSREAERREETASFFTLTQLPEQAPDVPFNQTKGKRLGWLRIDQQMDTLRAVVSLTAIGDAGTTEALRVLLPAKTRQWVAVPVGVWRIDIRFGRADEGEIVSYTIPGEVIERNRVYGLVLSDAVEQNINRLVRDKKILQSQTTSSSTGPNRNKSNLTN